jgi:hypothetical protein
MEMGLRPCLALPSVGDGLARDIPLSLCVSLWGLCDLRVESFLRAQKKGARRCLLKASSSPFALVMVPSTGRDAELRGGEPGASQQALNSAGIRNWRLENHYLEGIPSGRKLPQEEEGNRSECSSPLRLLSLLRKPFAVRFIVLPWSAGATPQPKESASKASKYRILSVERIV